MTAEIAPVLTADEADDLARCEAAIEAGLASFMQTGTMLLRVNDRRLYRESYATFEAYLADRWHISRRRGYELLNAAKTVEEVCAIAHTPPIENEGQARELAPIVRDHGPAAAAAVLSAVVEEGKPTAAAIRQKAEDMGHRPPRPAVTEDTNRPTPPPAVPLFAYSPPTDMLAALATGQPVVINLRDTDLRDWMSSRDHLLRVDRTSKWGNPFILDDDGTRDDVINAYRDHYLPNKPSLLGSLDQLTGKALGCWCAPEPCHADVLAEAWWKR